MTWNYRVIDHGDHVSIHEVFYDDAGRPTCRTEDPSDVFSEEGVEGLRKELGLMAKALELPVLTEADFQGTIE